MVRKHIAVATIALSVGLVACSKNNNSAKKAALPAPNKNTAQCAAAPSPLQSTAQLSVSGLDGTWTSPCLTADESWYGSPEIHTIQINGNVLVETVVSYSDDQCKTKSGCPDIGQSHFSLDGSVAENDYNQTYGVSYSDGDFKSVSGESVSFDASSEITSLTFSDEPETFSKSN